MPLIPPMSGLFRLRGWGLAFCVFCAVLLPLAARACAPCAPMTPQQAYDHATLVVLAKITRIVDGDLATNTPSRYRLDVRQAWKAVPPKLLTMVAEVGDGANCGVPLEADYLQGTVQLLYLWQDRQGEFRENDCGSLGLSSKTPAALGALQRRIEWLNQAEAARLAE